MNVQVLTASLLLVGLLAVGAVDIACQYVGQPTVSSTLRAWAANWPILPFTVGVLIGHLFWTGGPAFPPGLLDELRKRP